MNKRGWLRIFEAVVAIMLILGAVLLIYSNQRNESSESRYIMDWQEEILNRVAENETLRNAVAGGENETIVSFIEGNLLPNLNFSISICNLDVSCPMRGYVEEDIFVQERIVSGTIDIYHPKQVRFFVWKKG